MQIPDAIPQIAFGSVETFDLPAIPLNILLGEIMNESGLRRRIITAIRVWLRRLPHVLVVVNMLATLALAAIMGSARARMAVMSRVVVPEMEREGHDRGCSAGITAAAGLLGPIVPPSMIFIICGVSAEVPIGDMFAAGILPGVVLFALLLGLALWQAKRNHRAGGAAGPLAMGARIAATIPGLATMAIPLVIVAGIARGVFTPTGSAAALAKGPMLRLARLPAPSILAALAVILMVVLVPRVVRPSWARGRPRSIRPARRPAAARWGRPVMSQDLPVLIAGGGIGGLAAAIGLAGKGIPSLLPERGHPPGGAEVPHRPLSAEGLDAVRTRRHLPKCRPRTRGRGSRHP